VSGNKDNNDIETIKFLIFGIKKEIDQAYLSIIFLITIVAVIGWTFYNLHTSVNLHVINLSLVKFVSKTFLNFFSTVLLNS